MNLEQLHSSAEELERRLRLQTFPIAVKLLKTEADIPEGATRPKRDLGYHLNLCQAFAMSRREGKTMAMLKEDMWCFGPVIGYGLAEPPEYFLEGHNRFPRDVATLEAGSNFAHEFPRLETGKFIGVASASLTAANFEPDVVIIYCNSAQLGLLLQGMQYGDGRALQTALCPHAACVYSVVPAIKHRRYQVSIPCGGERKTAMAADDEMIFSVPGEQMEDLMLGLRHNAENGATLPLAHSMMPESEQPPGYGKTARMMGMDWVTSG